MNQQKEVPEEDFEQKRPPLSVTLKAILHRYPDGQIFKVCYTHAKIIN